MKLLVEPAGSRHRLAWLAGAIALVSLSLLGIAARAHASETIYWDNYNAKPVTIGFADINGTGGGFLNNANVAAPGTEVKIEDPEGLAYDPANGRIYIANSSGENILWVAIDGSGAGVLDTTGAPTENPEGIAVDPATQTVYWANTKTVGTIGFASANGGGGGTLNTAGASIEEPYKVALDTVHGRIYWMSGHGVVSYANLDGTGAIDLPTPASKAEQLSGTGSGIDVDPTTNRLYVLGENEEGTEGIIWLSTIGLGGGVIPLEDPATHSDPYGLAFDPAKSRFYWANYGHTAERGAVFGTTTLDGAPATAIGIATAPLDSPQDPVIVKSPVNTGAPQVTASGAQFSCSQGAWEADSPGSYVYAAPLSYAYQWSRDGAAIGGATGSSFTATQTGSYSCSVTASNHSGSTSQASSGHRVTVAQPKPVVPAPTPASLSLKPASKKAAKAKAGKTAVVMVDLTNGGGTASSAVKVCGTLTKAAKKGLVAPKCASVSSVPAEKTVVASLKVKTKATAKGTYKLTVNVTGALKGSLTAKVQVTAPKAKKPKHVSKGR